MNRCATRPALAASARRFAALLALWGLLAAASGPAVGETKKPRLGLVVWQEPECRIEAFHAGLRELGYVNGRDLVIECRDAGGKHAELITAAQAIVGTRPDVIVALHHSYAEAARQTGTRIPIVMISSGDPVATGFATSLARPGGNITGLTYYAGELNAKRLELLRSVVPGLKRVALLVNPNTPASLNELHLRDHEVAAKALGLELRVFSAAGEGDLERAFDEMAGWKAGAVHVLPSLVFAYQAQQIADLARWHRLPTMHFYTAFPSFGGLMAYGADFAALQRRTAVYVDKILKGAKPGELPFEQPTHFRLIVNRDVANELGLTIPQSVLLRADKVIE